MCTVALLLLPAAPAAAVAPIPPLVPEGNIKRMLYWRLIDWNY